ncbi:MAG TPA: hypothetical protein VNB90_01085 [Cytophagaceae bacterium]|jgi:hypothetical protein|nr:hypothetical protein [Cytophagaceae bacterium]
MQDIEPFYNWEYYYNSAEDERSPFYGLEYNYDQYSNQIYGYYIHPGWDYIGSETLYIKILFADYDNGVVIIEFLGEWNDTLHNDVMHLKRNVLDHFNGEGIHKYILIGENILNFHGSDDSYYEEWFEDTGEGWIAAVNFREHVVEEMKKFNIDSYLNFGGGLDIDNWRTMLPKVFYEYVNGIISKRLN